jgi:hypothetical protein
MTDLLAVWDAGDVGNELKHVTREKLGLPPVETPEESLIAWRETHRIPVATFCMNLYTIGRLPADQTIEAAQRKWPSTFDAGIAHLPEKDQVAAKLEWAAAINVRRNHPMIGVLRQLTVVVNGVKKPPMTETEVDALFGWVAP